MNDHCDLCGKGSDRLARVDDLWGLGVSTLCADAAECAETWAPGFYADPAETAILPYAAEVWRHDMDAESSFSLDGETHPLVRH